MLGFILNQVSILSLFHSEEAHVHFEYDSSFFVSIFLYSFSLTLNKAKK